VTLHRPFQVNLCNTWFEIQLHIERIQLEKISVRLTGGGHGPPKPILPNRFGLPRAVGKLFLARQPLRKPPLRPRNSYKTQCTQVPLERRDHP